jgi:hypothetical protein
LLVLTVVFLVLMGTVAYRWLVRRGLAPRPSVLPDDMRQTLGLNSLRRIQRRIVRRILDGAIVSLRRTYVQSRIYVSLSPAEYSVVAPFDRVVCDEIAAEVAAKCHARGWHIEGSVAVAIAGDPAVRSGDVKIVTSAVGPGSRRGREPMRRDTGDGETEIDTRSSTPRRGSPGARLRPALMVDGRTHLLRRTQIIGRAASCGVRLDHPGVSRRNTLVIVGGSRVEAQDLKSTNGTWLNGRRLDDRTVLAPGDKIDFGRSVSGHFVMAEASQDGEAETTFHNEV